MFRTQFGSQTRDKSDSAVGVGFQKLECSSDQVRVLQMGTYKSNSSISFEGVPDLDSWVNNYTLYQIFHSNDLRTTISH